MSEHQLPPGRNPPPTKPPTRVKITAPPPPGRTSSNGSTTIADVERMLGNDEYAAAIGRHIGNGLMINFRHGAGRWDTAWGDKTSAGLARTVFSEFMNAAADAERAARG